MFRKPFKVKSHITLKTSDRKKLKTSLLQEFPQLTGPDVDVLFPMKANTCQLKLQVHDDSIVEVVTVNSTPLIFIKDSRIFPTVYFLWAFPILMTFTTFPEVERKILNGADLMLPGLVMCNYVSTKPPNLACYGKFNKHERVCINTTENKACVAVGLTALCSYDMYMSAGCGKCVEVLHSVGDKLFAMAANNEKPAMGPSRVIPIEIPPVRPLNVDAPPFSPPTSLNADAPPFILSPTLNVDAPPFTPSSTPPPQTPPDVNNVVKSFSSVLLGTQEPQVTNQNPDPPAKKSFSSVLMSPAPAKPIVPQDVTQQSSDSPKTDKKSGDTDPNILLEYCFYKAISTSLKTAHFPVLVNVFYKKYVLDACPPGEELDIKKTTHKRITPYLEEKVSAGVIKLEHNAKNVMVTHVDFKHPLIKEFMKEHGHLFDHPEQTTTDSKTASPHVVEKYTVNAAVLPLFGLFVCRKGDVLTPQQIRNYVVNYIKSEKLEDPEDKKFVILNPVLSGILKAKSEKITWADLMQGIFQAMGNCFEVRVAEKKIFQAKGKLAPITLQVANRKYSKKVTLINNLTLYGINLDDFARDCQRTTAASTSINKMVPGTKCDQLQVQGNHAALIKRMLTENYNIPPRYIQG